MKVSTRALIGLLATAAAAPAFAQYGSPAPEAQARQGVDQKTDAAPQSKLRPSQKALKAVVDLQTAVNANDFASVPAKVAAAQAVASTKEDRYIIGQLQLKAALASKDNAALSAAVDTIAASGYLDGPKTAQLYLGLGSTFYNAKQFDQAAAVFQRAAAADPRNADVLINLAESQFSAGRKADSAATFQRSIQVSLAAGQKPKEEVYKRAVAVAYGANLPTSVEIGRQWVAAYPSPTSWKDSISIYRNLKRPDVEGTLDLLRLVRAAGALNAPADYSLYASAAAEQLNYNEAQAVIDQGLAAKHFDANSALLKDTIAALKKKPMATAADLETATKTATSGMALLRIGDRYYGLGQYAKAADLYRQAVAKGGVDSNLANLHIGMALAQSGDKAGAATALNAVTGQYGDVAKFWLLYVQAKA
jgi:tetratricopeptide (TPR) repeat protein